MMIIRSHSSWKYRLNDALKAAAAQLSRGLAARMAEKRFFAMVQPAGVPYSTREGSPFGPPQADGPDTASTRQWTCPWCQR
eukprot:6452244-Pyramimonas_sp.AAC.1